MTTSNNYHGFDRALYRLAFAGKTTQLMLSEIEDRIFTAALADITVTAPVFITSLPRAGTTLLLEILSRLPDVACHTYRNMPFVLCPMLWEQLSHRFRKPGELRERAHGDGLLVGYDSPEAFEEILWMTFWKKKYTERWITPWTAADRDEPFETFFVDHMRKIIAISAKHPGSNVQKTYVSKNNANVARLDLLPRIFPNCRILIPFRSPLQHAASLCEQHNRFVSIHKKDRFGHRYMEWLGHFEFGAALRPIDFANWISGNPEQDPARLEFWLTYWAVTYEAIAATSGPGITFINYDRACAEPDQFLGALATVLQLKTADALVAQAHRFREPTSHDVISDCVNSPLQQRANTTYEWLCERSI